MSPATKPAALQPEGVSAACLSDDWFASIEAGLLDRVRAFIETMPRAERAAALARPGSTGEQPHQAPPSHVRIPAIGFAAGTTINPHGTDLDQCHGGTKRVLLRCSVLAKVQMPCGFGAERFEGREAGSA